MQGIPRAVLRLFTGLAFAAAAATCPTVSMPLPPCPQKGCLPCPAGSAGHPDCTCTNGFFAGAAFGEASTTTPVRTTISAIASAGNTVSNGTTLNETMQASWAKNPECSLNVEEMLRWGAERGWLDKCVPDNCGTTPQPAHTTAISTEESPKEIAFPQLARFLCDVGYTVESTPSKQVAPCFLCETSAQAGLSSPLTPTTYTRSETTSCGANSSQALQLLPKSSEAECRAACDGNATCAFAELTCSGCRLWRSCQERAASSCGTLLEKRKLDSSRLAVLQCAAGGVVQNLTGGHCMPVCGDGRFVATEHLPKSMRLEQCDDGNIAAGDGCSERCRVEAGWVCSGGSPSKPDKCVPARAWASSAVELTISGRRAVGAAELRLATEVALAVALDCPERDLEITQILLSTSEDSPTAAAGGIGPAGVITSTTTTKTTTSTTTGVESRYHGSRLQAKVSFKVKVSGVGGSSIATVEGMLSEPSSFLLKLMVAYVGHTSLSDLHVNAVFLMPPVVSGDGGAEFSHDAFNLGTYIERLTWQVLPVVAYLLFVGVVSPVFYWYARIRPREYGLKGRWEDIEAEMKLRWSSSLLCGCVQDCPICCSLLFCLPARIADTWDAVGMLSYWAGVRQAFCCCLMYLGGCGVCAAHIPGKRRADIRDFFGFGDKVKGNMELSDWMCYLCFPLCCVVQEAHHVDKALYEMPPPAIDYVALERELRAAKLGKSEPPPEQQMIDDRH